MKKAPSADAATAATYGTDKSSGNKATRRLSPDTVIALAVFAATVVLLVATASNGYVRDEGFYFRAAREYNAWSFDFSDAGLTKTFGYNTEHPGFVKILMGITWRSAHVALNLCNGATGFRLGAIFIVATGAAFTYLFAVELSARRTRWRENSAAIGAMPHPRATALIALVFLFSAPHVFYHAHLACFDGPIMALIIASTYAFWRSTESKHWIIPACVLWGLALATKHNAVFTLAGFCLAAAIVRWRKPPLSLLLMPVIGLIVFYIFYPYGWWHPLERIGAYYNYHAHHEHYPVDFFGTLYVKPPFPVGYAFRMTALTVPFVTLVLGVVGLAKIARTARAGDESLRWGCVLLLIGALVPPLVISFPSVPIFGGTKHWMPMMPFLCIAAAATLTDIVATIRAPLLRYALPAVALLLPSIETIRTHPNGQTYFNELTFGHQGGAYFGLPRTFWGGDGRAMLASLNEKADQNAKVYTHRMNAGDWQQYREDALVRRDLIYVKTPAEADWGLMYHQREHQETEYLYWQRGGVLVDTLMYDGVPLVSLYRLPRAAVP